MGRLAAIVAKTILQGKTILLFFYFCFQLSQKSYFTKKGQY
jgi:hypothetical protein